MKNVGILMIFAFLIVFVLSIQNVFATLDSPTAEELEKARNTIKPALQVIHRSPYDIWNEHDLIIDGTIIASMPQKTEPVTLQYEIRVNEYFKPAEKPYQLITAIANETSVYFEPETRALFYLKKIEGGYKVSVYSVKTTQNCEARDLIQISPTLPNEDSFVRGAPSIPADWVDPCVPDYFAYDPDFFTFREPITPLKQLKQKIPLDKIQCYDIKVLVFRPSDGSPACVRPETKLKLIERGWALDSVKQMNPVAIILKEKRLQIKNVPLTTIEKTTTSHFENGGLYETNDSLSEMTLSHGVSSDGEDVIAATITNTGQEKFYVKRFGISGETDHGISSLESLAIDSDYDPKVSPTAPASKMLVKLNPGESLSAYIKGKWIAIEINQPITKFGGTVLFYFDNSSIFYDRGYNWEITITS